MIYFSELALICLTCANSWSVSNHVKYSRDGQLVWSLSDYFEATRNWCYPGFDSQYRKKYFILKKKGKILSRSNLVEDSVTRFKIYHFSSEIIFGQLLQTSGDFLLVTLQVINNNAALPCQSFKIHTKMSGPQIEKDHIAALFPRRVLIVGEVKSANGVFGWVTSLS